MQMAESHESNDEMRAGAARVTDSVGRITSELTEMHDSKNPWAKFDLAMAGVSQERKEAVQRIIVNLGLRPDDPETMLLCVAGHTETLALALNRQLDDSIEKAGEAMSKRLSLGLGATEMKFAKRIAEMEEAAIVVTESAVASAIAQATEATGELLSRKATEEVAALSMQMADKIKKTKDELFTAMNRIVAVKVKEEKVSQKAVLEKTLEKMKWFGIGVAAGVFLILVIQKLPR
jgi:chaperonin GroEL (HSP60 family)